MPDFNLVLRIFVVQLVLALILALSGSKIWAHASQSAFLGTATAGTTASVCYLP